MSKDKSEECDEKKMDDKEKEEPESMDQNNSNENDRKVCSKEERNEYFKQLEKWLHEAYAWQTFVAIFPYCGITNPLISPLAGISTLSSSPSNIRYMPMQNGQHILHQPGAETLRTRVQEQNGPFQPPGVEGFEYKIPPLWKRCLAELIDFMMLFCLKLGITFIILDFINVETYNLDMLQKNLRIDYKMMIEVTSNMLILELIYRSIMCIYEACWLQRGLNGRIGGATPGKSLMGLRVVQCHSVTPIERPAESGEYVLVSPGTDLGWPLAFGRSLVKNVILALIFPICFALCFFRFNRTGYDLLCSSIVVEDPYRNRNMNNNQNNRFHRAQF